MATAKVIVNGVNMLIMPEFREVLKNYNVLAPERLRLVGFVETRWNEPEVLDRVMHCTQFSSKSLQAAKAALMETLEEYDRVEGLSA